MEVQQTLGGRYTLLNELGTGGMSVVWRAQDEVLGRPVAVKVLAGRYAGDPGSRARIRDEARAAAALSHPNIAQVYDFGESQDNGSCLPYVVMELINGPTLAQRVKLGPLPPRTVFRIGAEVAAALAAAHADGLVHRDIKPANVMVTAAGAKVVDFGLAAVAGPIEPAEQLLGTPAYLAPERLTGDAVQPASDVYALGVLLYRLLTNHSPWSVETTTQMLDAHVYIEPDPLPPLPGVPPTITDLVRRCLHKDPAERPTAAEASAILATAAGKDAESVADEPERKPPAAVAGVLDDGRVAAAPIAATGGAAPAESTPGEAPAGESAPGESAPGESAPGESAPGGPAPVGRPGRDKRLLLLLVGSAVAIALLAALLAWTLVPGAGRDTAGPAVVTPHQPSGAVDDPDAAGTVPAPGPADGTAADDDTVPQPGAVGPQATGGSAAPAGPEPQPGEATTTPGRTGGGQPTAGAPPTTGPTAQGRTLSSVAGSVVAECTGGKAHLTSWSAKDPYQVERVNAGPVLAATAVFRTDASRIRMTVTCVAGVPTAVVLPL
ncbi:MAG TPA: protein kinase [Actinoplanes sp.]|nr:protein kinase [Actinoplanes sp.]